MPQRQPPQTPPPNHLLTTLLNTLTTLHPNPPPQPTPLTTLAHPTTKSILLTLHFLFPHDLLPALDLIDRSLITQLSCATTTSTGVYYVQSSSSSGKSKGRFRDALAGAYYEVRLDAWNCSCAAFAFCWLRLDTTTPTTAEGGGGSGGVHGESEGWVFGGTTTRGDQGGTPVCKHLLAVVLAKVAPEVFGGGVVRRVGTREEIAGWAAGWGDC